MTGKSLHQFARKSTLIGVQVAVTVLVVEFVAILINKLNLSLSIHAIIASFKELNKQLLPFRM